MTRPRVFVSSIVKNFAAHRAAASSGIQQAGAEPVLVNEGFSADPRSSRNACLDGVASCDAVVLIIATRGGWATPSGKLVIEEEYEEATRQQLPVYVFVETGTADADAKRFGARVSDYIDGRFRREFSSPEELEKQVFSAVRGLSSIIDMQTTSPTLINSHLRERAHITNEPVLRVVLAPERREELISPVELGGDPFEKSVYRLGHEGESPLFDYARPKSTRVEGESLVIEQTDPESRHHETHRVWLSVDEHGVMVIEANVGGGHRGAHSGFPAGLAVYVADLETTLRTMFAFAAAFYAQRDPYKRHHRLLYNVGLLGVDFRKILRTEPKGGVPMNIMRGSNEPLSRTPRRSPDLARSARTIRRRDRADGRTARASGSPVTRAIKFSMLDVHHVAQVHAECASTLCFKYSSACVVLPRSCSTAR